MQKIQDSLVLFTNAKHKMNINQTYYCKLQYCSDFEYPENILLRKPRRVETTGYLNTKVYVEEYYNFESLKDRIDDFYSLLVEGYRKQNIDIYSDRCSFREFTFCNRFNDSIKVGISSSGWNISILFFSYLWDYFEEKYGKIDGDRRYLKLADSKEIWFYSNYHSEPNFASACNLVSEETAYIILKEFLDTGTTEEKLDPEIFHREISKRNY